MASKFALLLLLAVQCVTFANAQPCSVLFGASSLQSTAINSPCVTLNSGDSAKLSKSFDQTGTSISSIDLGNGVFSLGLAGFQLTLSNVTLLSSVIFPPSSQAAALNGPLPAAFDLRTGGAVQLRNAIVFTSNCSAITQWSNFITQSSSCSATSFFIPFFSYPQANLTNVTLTCNRSLILKQVVSCPPGCNGNSSSLPSSFVHNGAELSSNLPPLTSLSSPFVVNALANIDLTSQPPWTIAIGSNATLNGGGGWLNLAGNPSLATLATTPRTTLSLLNFVIFNECVQFDPTNPRLQPNQQLAIASTLPGVVYSNATKYQPPPFLGLYVQNSTIVVSQDEVQALTYWHVALLSPSAFLGSPSLSAMSLQIPVQSLSLQAPPTPTSLSVNVMSGPGLLYNNVFITSQPPQLQMVSPTQYICNSPNGTKLDPSVSVMPLLSCCLEDNHNPNLNCLFLSPLSSRLRSTSTCLPAPATLPRPCLH